MRSETAAVDLTLLLGKAVLSWGWPAEVMGRRQFPRLQAMGSREQSEPQQVCGLYLGGLGLTVAKR